MRDYIHFWDSSLAKCAEYTIKGESKYTQDIGFVPKTVDDVDIEYLKREIDQVKKDDLDSLLETMEKNSESLTDIVGKTSILVSCTSYRKWAVWTKNYIYFPAMHDGHTWAASASRNPYGEGVEAVGGG